MDTSETYIKMRFAAIPDLEYGCKPQLPLHYFTDNTYVDSKGDFYYSNENNELCQLERQDQLQEMVDAENLCMKVAMFYKWVVQEVAARQSFHSMEQLWLAFRMKEKFNKTWSGENWE